MVNEASFSVSGYVATPPRTGYTRDGTRTLYMRVGWTPRRMNKRTGDWEDQPTSFVSVICYRRVAENAAACLRRGDPIVLKGTLRVREYGDDKRATVDVVAGSIGHDLSRGMTVFNRSTVHFEQTALERERAMAAAGREPLPGDRPGQEQAGQQDPGGGHPAGIDAAGDYPAELEPGAAIGLDLDDGEGFDDEEARQMLAHADPTAEPVGVAEPVG